jgi:PAS domain S-box-containing protein
MSHLGRYIKERREALAAMHSGYSIRSVAKRIGIHHSYLSKLERGENAPLTEERIHALARFLGEDPEILMALAGKVSEHTAALIKSNLDAFAHFLSDLETRTPAPGATTNQRLAQRKNELEELTRLLRDEIQQRQVLEGQLREQQKVQSTILENLRDVSVVMLDPQFRIVWSNAPVTETPSRLLTKSGASICAETGNGHGEESAFCTALRALKTRTVQNGVHRSPDGKHWLLRSAPVLDADGAVAQIVHLQFEVTEILRARRALEASEERWKLALEGSQGAVWDYDIPSGRIQHSPMWMSMLGYAGNEFELTMDRLRQILHPDDLQAAMDAFSAHLRGETEYFDTDFRLQCKDGSYKWIHSRGKLVERDTVGAPLRITGTNHDLSERKAFEEQILANEAFLECLLGSIEEGISVLAPDLTVRYANRTMTSWYAETLPAVGRKCHEVFHQMGECCSRCPAVRALRSGRNEFEVMQVNSSEAMRSIEFSAYPIRELPEGAPTGVIVFVRDITARTKRLCANRDDRQESRYREMFELAPIGMCSVDGSGRFISMNLAYAGLHGYASPRDMMQAVRRESDTYAASEGDAGLRERLVAGETVQGERYRIRRKDGTTAPAVRSAKLVTDAHDGSRRIDIFVDAVRENQGIHTSGDKTARTKP